MKSSSPLQYGILAVLILGLINGCSAFGVGGGGVPPAVQLQQAQQTLDALNAGSQDNAQDVESNSGQPNNNNPSDGNSSNTATPSRGVEIPTTTPTPTKGASRGVDTNGVRIIEFDNQGMAWEAGCWSIRQPMGEFGDGWYEDDHWFGANLDCEMAFDIPVGTTGTYDVFLVGTYAPDFGNLSLSFQQGIEKSDFMNISLYSPDIKPTDEISLGQWHFLVEDTNQFIVRLYGKADQSTNYNFGLDYLKLILVSSDP
jgi:hypothetical protein